MLWIYISGENIDNVLINMCNKQMGVEKKNKVG